jgi:hypothetical protein
MPIPNRAAPRGHEAFTGGVRVGEAATAQRPRTMGAVMVIDGDGVLGDIDGDHRVGVGAAS